MYTSILSATMQGIRAIPVQVEVDVSPGLPGFSMVGTVNSQVREAQDRVRTALHNLEIPVPPRRITINLSPAGLRKDGTAFDLARDLSITAHREELRVFKLQLEAVQD